MSRTRVVAASSSATADSERPTSTGVGRTLIVVAVLCALVLMLVVSTGPGSLRTHFSEQSRAEALSAEHAQLLSDIARLEAQKKLQDDPAYIKEQARIRLQYVMPGETAYRAKVPGAPALTPEQAEAEQAKQNPWYTNVWRTIAVPH